METSTNSDLPQDRNKLTAQRGNFYYGMGFALAGCLLAVLGLGLIGIPSLGVFSVTTAMAMIAIAITLISIVSFVTLVTLRRTLALLNHHEAVLASQAKQHADLAAKVQAQWRAEQVIRDRSQDADLASLSRRQDSSFVTTQRVAVGAVGRRPMPSPADPFEGGSVYPVREVEGIGDHYAKLLTDMGITDTRKLWNADATYLAGGLKIAPAAVEGWQCMAELMAVNGIGKQYAELLVRADISSIDELCAETPQPLLNRIHRLEQHQGNRIQGNTIGIKVVQSWISAAQAHHGVIPVAALVGTNGPGA